MRLAIVAALLLTACATAPQPAPAVAAAEPAAAATVVPQPIPGPVDVREVPFSGAATAVEVSGGTGEVIELRFGWPAGGAADIHFTASRTSHAVGAPPGVQLARGVIALAAEGVPADRPTRLAIRTTTRSIETEGSERELPGMMAAIAVAVPLESRWAVDADGALVERPTTPNADELIEGMLRSRNLTMEDGIRQALRRAATPEMLQTRAAEFWLAIVGGWAGGKIELGAVYRMRNGAMLPNGVNYTSTMELQAVGRVPCTEDETEARCVRFELRNQPDAAAEEAMMAPMVEQMRLLLERNNYPGKSIAGMGSTSEQVLIVEPDGLFPRHYVQRIRTTVRIDGPVPRGCPTETIDERVAAFEWTAR